MFQILHVCEKMLIHFYLLYFKYDGKALLTVDAVDGNKPVDTFLYNITVCSKNQWK